MSDCCSKKPALPSLLTRVWPYRPLIIAALVAGIGAGVSAVTGRIPPMDAFMGLFLVIVGFLKLLDVQGFAQSFRRYDILARIAPPYAILYPFLETTLGVLFLVGVWPVLTHVVTLALAVLGTIGALRVIQKKQIVTCACAGAGFNIPVGWVTVFEYSAMAVMAVMGLGMMR